MTWVRIDDHLHSHPKILRAWNEERASLGLHLLALSYAGAVLTDGVVDDQAARQWLPAKRERERATDALTDARLWVPNGSGWVIHDWLDYNEPREVQIARRRAREARRRENRDRHV